MEKLFEIIRQAFGANQDHFDDDIEFKSLENWDSFTHMLFITQLEKELSIELSGDEIVEMKTIGDLKQVIGNRANLKL